MWWNVTWVTALNRSGMVFLERCGMRLREPSHLGEGK